MTEKIKKECKDMAGVLVYVIISLFLMMLSIVLGFSILVVISIAIGNLTFLEREFMGIAQLLFGVPLLGGLTGLTGWIRHKWFRLSLLKEEGHFE